MKKKEGAIELSMTTIIVIVIGITLLSLALVWVKGVFSDISELSEEAFRNADKEIRDRMREGTNFYVSGQTFEVEPGDITTINVGVRNILGSDSNFAISVSGEKAAWFQTPDPISVKAGEVKGIPIVLKVPKSEIPGNTYTATVMSNPDVGSESIVIIII